MGVGLVVLTVEWGRWMVGWWAVGWTGGRGKGEGSTERMGSWKRVSVLDQIEALEDLQAVVEAADVDAAAVAAHLAADAAGAELVRNRRLRLQREFYTAALAACVEFPGRRRRRWASVSVYWVRGEGW